MIYGILLIYYPEYANAAINCFRSLLSGISKDHHLIVVDNACCNLDIADATYISGDNENWEFSGWQKGLDLLKSRPSAELVIFANDTFASHRNWRSKDERAFSKGFQRLTTFSSVAIAGEVNLAAGRSELMGLPAGAWVSTYLFAVTPQFLKSVDYQLCLPESQLDTMVYGIRNGRVDWGTGVNAELKTHIEQWIFPTAERSGWYKAASASDAIKLRKIKTILNEKYLSGIARDFGGVLVDVSVFEFKRRVKRILARLINIGK
jgi:hypothetical protein